MCAPYRVIQKFRYFNGKAHNLLKNSNFPPKFWLLKGLRDTKLKQSNCIMCTVNEKLDRKVVVALQRGGHSLQPRHQPEEEQC